MNRFRLLVLVVAVTFCFGSVAYAGKKISVSAGVIQGNKLGGMTPIYPPIAKEKKIEGTVVLHVSISTEGVVEEVTPISGPEELRDAAVEAVKTWRYKPYLLNGKAVEVDSQVNVQFTLSRK
jgi:periplasmic protein TonB